MQSEMRGLLDAMPCKVWYKDGLNNILRVNALAAKSMGLAISDIEGKNTYDLFGDSAKKYHEDDLRVINSGKPLLDIVERYTPNEAQLLERDSDLSENSVHKSYLDSIQDNVREMRVMIDSLLKFMRSKPKTTDLKPVNLSQVFARVSERHMADMEDIGATMELPEIEIFVQGDETLLEQVFNNLEIFGRAKSSADREGYGIGLAICKRIVVLHGGTITHLTAKEQGAEFVLRLKASKHSKN